MKLLEEAEDTEEVHYLETFREALVHSFLTRFATSPDDAGKRTEVGTLSATGNRRIVTVHLFSSPIYLMATVLDPRIKTSPFICKFFIYFN